MGTRREHARGLGVLAFASPLRRRGAAGTAVVYVRRATTARRRRAARRAAPVERHDVDVRGLRGAAPRGARAGRRAPHAERPRQLALHGGRRGRGDARHRRAGRGASRSTARRVSIWGASMGGAGATTVGFHHPDRFAERHELLRRLEVRRDDVRARHPARRGRRAPRSTRSTWSTTRAGSRCGSSTARTTAPRPSGRARCSPQRDARRGLHGALRPRAGDGSRGGARRAVSRPRSSPRQRRRVPGARRRA